MFVDFSHARNFWIVFAATSLLKNSLEIKIDKKK